MANARIQWNPEQEVSTDMGGGLKLCLQWVRYVYEGGELEEGYRFIWRRQNGNLQAARGQARIPSLEDAKDLIKRAEDAGWGHLGR
jgi:hypothetical protein